ncbi:MAG: acyl-homoserine-lactone synthase [Tabrizicola sp.]|uniref:acyl-homoserine-lactone synthase n=1 Tax=Tabrizicola sp. TaxID=2005166 RepID=UPI0027332240|nr:acyl-homoserine-lactone synthase [Tabrizicola sp.]MDP3263993.1 acyl-homoserine-lactone synthase [Tabrizicola sp.]MDP3649629.1 acyl-homoserine-lactone synthase [Paracoccaceae bacterium]MDZ4067187.1 acyl-homoserine-lactone synthase [Tabrizicola sp.]
MEVTTLSYDNLHKHGELFANMFRARHRAFIQQNRWNLPEANGMEFDQYDTPASRWLAVHQNGEVLAGIRLTPTTHRCGIYSYMIRDAQKGLLESIPANLLNFEAPVASHIWESSRVFVSDSVPASMRLRVQLQLRHEMVVSARALGATTVLGLIPESSRRLGRRVGLECEPAGPLLDFDGVECVCVTINMSSKLH